MLESALLFLVFFGPLAFGCVETWSVSILQVVLFSLPVLALRARSKTAVAAPRALLIAIGAIVLIGVFQALNPAPPDGPLPWLPFTASAKLTGKALLLWAAYGALVWSAPRAFAEPAAARRFAWALVLIGFTISVIGLIQSAHGNALIMGFRKVSYGHSPFGPYYNNGHAASLLAVCALMGLWLLGSDIARTFGRDDRSKSRADGVARQVMLAFLVGINVLGLLVTRNRGSILALGGASLAVGLLACGFLKRPSMRWGARAGLLLLFLGAAAGATKLGLMRRGAQTSVPVRLSMYKSGLTLLADAPLWGTGLGTVIAVFKPYKEPLVDGVVDHVHSDWLELPLQAGIPAAVVVLSALIAFGWRVQSRWKAETSVERRFLIGGGVAACLCFLFHAGVEFTWQIPANAVIFLLLLSWLWSQTGRGTIEARIPTRIR